MRDERPDPDLLLAHVKEVEARQSRGQLKIFLGAAPGVGKTYAMLEAAHQRRAEGVDTVVGWVDTHGRAETEALLHGLEVLPRRRVDYRGTRLTEFDLDAALARRPALMLVDEAAHTNAPDSRHPKRWQDIHELLDAGIHVYTTLNIQHLESLNDVVAKITGIQVRETLPDAVLEQADEVELVDLPPDELIQRLKEGKVYVPDQAREAVGNFFRKGNLIALRELALRQTAERVDDQMRRYRLDHAIRPIWPVAERVLACVTSSPHAPGVIRAAKRLADTLRAPWIAFYVETTGHDRLTETDRARVTDTLRLAEQLGAEAVTLPGARIVDEILSYARQRNVSKIVIGKPRRAYWRRLLSGSIADSLIEGSGDTDVYVISAEEPAHIPYVAPAKAATWRRQHLSYGLTAAVVAACTGIAWVMFPWFELSNLIMVYLLGVVGVAVRWGQGPAALAAVLSVAAFDFFFVPPYFSFAVSDTQYLVTFFVMFVVALVISGLTVRIRWLADAARQRERRTAVLAAMNRELAALRGVPNILNASVRHMAEVFGIRLTVLVPGPDGRLTVPEDVPAQFPVNGSELAVAQWAHEHRQPAGIGTQTLAGAAALYLPLIATRGVVAVLGVLPADPHAVETPEQRHLLETFANQAALAMERAQLADEAHAAQVRSETERLRSSLLSSVSHDLRTPLSAITGAASTLLQSDASFDPAARRDMLETIREEADRLGRLVQNLLDMTRLESGSVEARKDWHTLEEVIGAALSRLAPRLRDRKVELDVPTDLPLVPMDDVLIEQVLINLLDNAVKYTPAGTPIGIAARVGAGTATVEVADRGPGLGPGDKEKIFEKFYRGNDASGRGAGLGLAICRGFVEAHGGRIWAENRPGGGAILRFTIPFTGAAPVIEANDA